MAQKGQVSHELLIVSDLHLSEGWHEKTKRLSQNEDFFFDASFERLLNYLICQAREKNITYRLVINGDFVDFLQVVRPDLSEGIGKIGEMRGLQKKEKSLALGQTKRVIASGLRQSRGSSFNFLKN